MPEYQTPGVYIEEVSTGPRPVESVGTSTAAFLGKAQGTAAEDRHRAIPVNNWAEFNRRFVKDAEVASPLVHAVYGFFENGGRRCFVVDVGDDGIAPVTRGGQRKGLAALEPVDEVAIVAAPGYADPASWDALLTHCEKLKDRVAVLDAPENVDDPAKLAEQATMEATPRRSRAGGAAAEGGEGGGATTPEPPRRAEGGAGPRRSDYGALYFPWITVRDPLDGKTLVNVAPSGHMAGVWARTDGTRGVHKAPANEIVRGAVNVSYQVTHSEQGALNPAGINVIRFFPTAGIRVWGARTLAEPGSEWRYVNVRRLFNMVEESIGRATRWVVFEPNDHTLWNSIKRDVGAYLTRLWRAGALVGRTPEQAFFVKCDEETNPPESIDAGEVNVFIGIAPVKPAEFVIFKIGQHAAGQTVTEEKKNG